MLQEAFNHRFRADRVVGQREFADLVPLDANELAILWNQQSAVLVGRATVAKHVLADDQTLAVAFEPQADIMYRKRICRSFPQAASYRVASITQVDVIPVCCLQR